MRPHRQLAVPLSLPIPATVASCLLSSYAVLHRNRETVLMKNITVSVDEEIHRLARIRAAELETSVSALVRAYLKGLVRGAKRKSTDGIRTAEGSPQLRYRDLDEVLADFDARGVGLRSSDNLTRDELYDEAIGGPDALR